MSGFNLSYNPFVELVNELKEKMAKLLPELNTLIAIADDLADIKYIDPELEKERLDYIKDYVSSNFSLIEIGQYSLPLSGVLLGFFKISENVMLILYSETGKIGNLLAYRGLVNTYAKKIDECLDLLREIDELESTSYEIIRLKKVAPIEVTSQTSIEITEKAPSTRLMDVTPNLVFPKLDQKFASKKFAFKEGLILQHCSGKNSIEDIINKSNFSKEEVEEVIEKYESKGWLEVIYKQ